MYSENESCFSQGLPMPIRYFILWCLARGICYGYDIRRAMAAMTDGLWVVNPGHVYQAFRTLERDGLVALGGVVVQESFPDRKEYTLTEAGHTALAAWLATPVPQHDALKDEALFKLLLLSEAKQPDEMELFLAAQRQCCEQDRQRLVARCAALPPEDRRGCLIVQAGIAAIDAHLHWLTQLEPAVAKSV